ncbi:uncharacterized protein LOC119673970 [Teleopsis dalmanni]|uniref:uncharacterized protein LOC119673970 n=1 Tax=Teleopsis dalmanni TaxID=139649 RepID=UPI0018CD7E70|nr:uncharacterized protein LOC119673970 [Teleopsis dalmanni]
MSNKMCALCKVHKRNLTSAYKYVDYCGERKKLSEVIALLKRVEISQVETSDAKICEDCNKDILVSIKIEECIRINRSYESRYLRYENECNGIYSMPLNPNIVDLEAVKQEPNGINKVSLVKDIENMEKLIEEKEQSKEATGWKFVGEVFEQQRKSKTKAIKQPPKIDLAPICGILQEKMNYSNNSFIGVVDIGKSHNLGTPDLDKYKSNYFTAQSPLSNDSINPLNFVIAHPFGDENKNDTGVTDSATESKPGIFDENANKYSADETIKILKQISENAVTKQQFQDSIANKRFLEVKLVDLADCTIKSNSDTVGKSTQKHNIDKTENVFKKSAKKTKSKHHANGLKKANKGTKFGLVKLTDYVIDCNSPPFDESPQKSSTEVITKHIDTSSKAYQEINDIQLNTFNKCALNEKWNILSCYGSYDYQEQVDQYCNQNIELSSMFKISKDFTIDKKIFNINNGFKIEKKRRQHSVPEIVSLFSRNYFYNTDAFINYCMNFVVKDELMENIELGAEKINIIQKAIV